MSSTLNKKEPRFTLIRKVGFGMGGMPSSLMNGFYLTYFLFFLTSIAGIKPALAGTIIMIGTIWQAIINLLVGFYSDRNFKNKQGEVIGRKRPFIIRTAFPVGITFALLFVAFDIGTVGKAVYFIVLLLIYFFVYSLYEVPYYSLAANLSNDSNERTSLRMVATNVEYFGTFMLGVVPPSLIPYLEKVFDSDSVSWGIMAVAVGVISTLGMILCWVATKGKEIIAEKEEEEKFNLREILYLFKLKPMVIMFFAAATYFFYYTMSANSFYIYMYENLGLDGNQISFIYGAGVLFSMLIIYVSSRFAMKFDKRIVFFVALTLTGCSFIIFHFVGISSFNMILFYLIIDSINGGTYWTLIYPFIYDVVDLDEYITGNRREGSIMGIYCFIITIASALTAQIEGIIMQMGGYDGNAAAQTPEAANTIFNMITIYPAIGLLLTALIMMQNPITIKRADAVSAALELKRQGSPAPPTGFEILVKNSFHGKQ